MLQKRYTHGPKNRMGRYRSSVYETDSQQLTLGCYSFLPGPRLPSQLQSVTACGRNQFVQLGEQKHARVNDLLKVATAGD